MTEADEHTGRATDRIVASNATASKTTQTLPNAKWKGKPGWNFSREGDRLGAEASDEGSATAEAIMV